GAPCGRNYVGFRSSVGGALVALWGLPYGIGIGSISCGGAGLMSRERTTSWLVAAAVSGWAAVAVAQQPAPAEASRLVLDDEPDWNAGEQSAAASQWDAATNAYLKTLRTTQKPWLKTRCALRLLDVAAKAG